MMKYPTLTQISELSALAEETSETDQMFSTMISCIDTLIDTSSDEVFKLSDFTSEEVTEFVDGFTTQTVEELQKFFTTMPKLRHVVDYKDNTGKDKTFVVEGMDSFFT
jgi:hypothetical protein